MALNINFLSLIATKCRPCCWAYIFHTALQAPPRLQQQQYMSFAKPILCRQLCELIYSATVLSVLVKAGVYVCTGGSLRKR